MVLSEPACTPPSSPLPKDLSPRGIARSRSWTQLPRELSGWHMRRRMGFQLWDLEKLGASLEGYKYKVRATNSRKVPTFADLCCWTRRRT